MMNLGLQLALIIVLLLEVTSFETYKKIVISSPNAKCLDGTQPIIYFKQGKQQYKWIIYFEGGGWCGTDDYSTTLQDCYLRSFTYVGTCQYDPDEVVKNGILSSDPERNWYYHDYTSVFIRYCDGTGHQGYSEQPYVYNNTNVWFRGQSNTIEVINYIKQNLNFTLAEEVMVAGSSAGSVSVMTWIDYIASQLPSNIAATNVYGVVDAGVFLDEKNVVTNEFWYRSVIQNFLMFSNNNTALIPQQCNDQYSDETWKCMMGQYLMDFVQQPLFFAESLYDLWSLTQILGITCVTDKTMRTCSSSNKQVMETHRTDMLTLLQFELDNNPSWGAWLPSCIFHDFTQVVYDNINYEIPSQSDNSLQVAIQTWRLQVNNLFFDSQSWPSNRLCSGL